MTMAKADPPVDGRTARRDRNSEAVLDAVQVLFQEGRLVPSVEEVAQRSGVSLRSVYRYFEDSDDVLRAAIARRVAFVEPLFDLPRVGEGTLEQRIRALVDHRLALWDHMGPAFRALMVRAASRPPIAEQVGQRRDLLMRQTQQQFAPELKAMGRARAAEVLSCLDVITQPEALERLSQGRGLSRARVRATLIAGVTALLSCDLPA